MTSRNTVSVHTPTDVHKQPLNKDILTVPRNLVRLRKAS